MADFQDWHPVVISKSAKNPDVVEKKKKEQEERTKERKEAPKPRDFSAKKIEEDQDTFVVERVPQNLKMAIQQARVAKGWTQKEFAMKVSVQLTVINSYENGTAIPNNQLIARMEKILGTKLPRPAPKKEVKE
eukprot:gnl/Chilomastix_caulleri/645.p1 GENE.gnl/Chilomastix_caulleri/645~~gnl/Chilomastix_caulleri/645.p1  ORF type:complete len:133 (+),score=42.74 gnl/Chilomastix_caulleri/645:65-463(+)